MTIVSIIHSLRSGGAEKQLLLTSRLLAKNGYRCVIFTLSYDNQHSRMDRLIQETERSGVRIYRPTTFEILFGLQFLRLFWFLMREREVLLWSWGTRSDLVAFIHCWLFPKAKLVRSLRAANQEKVQRRRWIERFVDGKVNLYTSNTWKSCSLLNQVVPGVLPRCRVIYNALDPHELEEPAALLPEKVSHLTVVMLGNLHIRIKGYDLVVELAERIKSERLAISIRIAGRSMDDDWLKAEIARRGLQNILYYEGEMSNPFDFLRTGHVFLLMSRSEGTPNSLLEAMNIGLPCIATRVGDVERFVQDGAKIRIVEIEDVSGVLRVLKEFFGNWTETRGLGEGGREYCRTHFTPVALEKDLLNVLAELGCRP